ncbi:MAG: Hpt domain-containing protein [Spirochaetes bacterium]|nr:Hpt domain-containing protein [Spirochaetota bacterium]
MRLLVLLGDIGLRRSDTPEIKLQKRFLIYLGSAMSMGGILWGTLCLINDLFFAAFIPYGYTFLTLVNFALFARFKNFDATRTFQVLISLLLPFIFQFMLGTFAATGGVMLWALIALVGAFTFEELRHTLYWIALYVVMTVALGLLNGRTTGALNVSPAVQTLFFVVNFSIISVIVSGLSYYFLKSRGSILTELAEAKKETDMLLATVDEGLLVVFRRQGQYEVGGEQSAAIRTIFEVDRLPQVSLTAALSPYLNPAKARELENYLTLLQSASVKKSMIRDLNPLELVHTSIGAARQEKYLQFSFWPVVQGKQDEYLIRIKDVTKATLLQQQLLANEKKNAENTNMILSVLHIGPNLLADFLAGVRNELSTIERVLQNDRPVAEVVENIEEVHRAAHSIKGNAALLDLKILASAAHAFEDDLAKLRQLAMPEWSDFIPLAVHVSKLQGVVVGLEELLQRLRNFRDDTGGKTESAVAAIPKTIGDMARRIAGERGKRIVVDTTAFHAEGIPNRFAYLLRDIGVQMARNSVVHGLEVPEEREKSGKPVAGTLTVGLKQDGGRLVFSLRDDGRSFDFEAIRKQAREKLSVSDAEAGLWDQKKLIRFMFEPGFSTAHEADLDAGRCMGLDIVKERVKQAGGEMKINFAPGKYTEFSIQIPIDSAQHDERKILEAI